LKKKELNGVATFEVEKLQFGLEHNQKFQNVLFILKGSAKDLEPPQINYHISLVPRDDAVFRLLEFPPIDNLTFYYSREAEKSVVDAQIHDLCIYLNIKPPKPTTQTTQAVSTETEKKKNQN